MRERWFGGKAVGALTSACLVLLFASCSEQPEPRERPKSNVEIRQEGTKVVATDVETGGQLIFGATDVPENFPLDLPIIPGATLHSHFTLQSTILATFFTSQSIDELKPFFLEGSQLQEQGWEIDRTQQQDVTFTIDMHKGNRRSKINLTPARNPAGTNVAYVATIE